MFHSKIIKKISGLFLIQKSEDINLNYSKKFKNIITSISDKKNGKLEFLLKNGQKVIIRLDPHSDLLVFEQVFLNQEYLPVCEYIINNLLATKSKNFIIIDAGANVGYTSLYFSSIFPQADIYSIEPDSNNFSLLKDNITLNQLHLKIHPLENALLGKTEINLTTNNNFRDGKDWAITVVESEVETNLKSISIPELVNKYEFNEIDILKIDIEGAERFLFLEDCNLKYLKIVKSIIIEIHDEFDCRSQIYATLKKYNFIILNLGESTLAINSRFINFSNKNN